MLWAFAALAMMELLVVHLIFVSRWPAIVWPVSVLTLLSLIWLVSWILSFKRRPHRIDGKRLLLAFGSLKTLIVPLASIRCVRSQWPDGGLKAPGVRKFVPMAYPNRMVELDPPVGRSSVIAFRVDDPAEFDSAMRAHGVAVD